jgi:hypothetical protein
VTTWAGWAADFLAAASLPDTARNRSFLSDWAANANHPNCGNNPIDLTRGEPGSTNCAPTSLVGVHAQRYTSHTWARTAFNSQIHSGDYPHLLGAFQGGNPYGVKSPGLVASNIGEWQSINFANVYLSKAQAGPTVEVKAAKAHKGWADIRHSFNHNAHPALIHAQHVRRAALRRLAHARRVSG